MSSKLSHSLKKMSREDLILLIRDLTLENEKLSTGQSDIGADPPALGERCADSALEQELRSLRSSVVALRESIEGWGETFARAAGAAESGADEEGRR